MDQTGGDLNATTLNFSNTSYLPEGYNPATDSLIMGDHGLIWTHYYTVNEILEKLIPVFLIFLFIVIYISHVYIAPKTILFLKSKYGRNKDEKYDV